ncbi:MAG TPA: secretin N-terminal domain-containing protein [Burkholderiales bacterium]|nr:secretin N-terminal domain-containing protein [Burkholderiales bacterium]
MRTLCTAGQIASALVTALIVAGCAQEPMRTPQHVDKQMIGELDKGEQRAKPKEPYAVSQALLPPLRMALPRAQGKPIEARFDLNVNNAPAREVFLSIVSGTRYSMLVSPDVSGTISVNLKDVSLTEALEAIREIYGYEYKIDGSRIYIKPAGLQTRMFHVNYLVGARQGRSDMRVTAGTSGIVTNAATTTNANINNTSTTPIVQGAVAPAPAAGAGAQEPPSMMPNASGALAGIQNDATRMSTVETTDFWAEVEYAIRTIVGTGHGRQIMISPQSGVVLVRAMPQELRSVAKVLKAMQISVDREVILQAKIIDVTLNHAYQAGINWAAFPTSGIAGGFTSGLGGANNSLGVTGSLSGSTSGSTAGVGSNFAANPGAGAGLATLGGTVAGATNVAGGVFGLAVQTKDFASLLQFLQTQGSVQVLSSPRVSTLNNQKAVLKVGTDQPYVTSISVVPGVVSSGVSTPTTVAPQISNIFSGVSLDVTPQIDDEGNIALHIHPLVTSVSSKTVGFNLAGVGAQSVDVAAINVSESDTMVRTTDGNIVVLGGLMEVTLNNGRSGIPGLADAPLIGGAFRNTSDDTVKRELVILIKPTIVDSDKDWVRDIQDSRYRLQHMDDGRRADRPD